MAKAVRKKQQPKGAPPAAAQAEVFALQAPKFDRRFWAVATALFIACFLIYGQVATHDFINYDDPNYVVKNSHVNAGVTASGIVWALRTFDFYYWQPLTWISHMIDCQVFGLKAGPHHVVNVILHALNSVLLFLAFWQFTGATWRSALVAALFAVHPLRVESVAWIAERKDVLSGLFWMLTLIAYGAYVRLPSRPRYAAMVAAFLCGIMSKPSTVTLPFVLLLLDWWPLGRIQSQGFMAVLKEKLPLFGVVAGASILTFTGQHQMGATVSLTALPLWFRTWNALISYVKYIGKFLLPVDLGVLYPYGKIPASTMLGAALLLGAITGIVLLRARRNGYLIVGWLWFMGAMVPMIGLAQTGLQAMADRFTYLPMIGLAMMVVWGAADALRGVPVRVTVSIAGLLLGILAFASLVQASYWKDSFTLFNRTIAVTNDNDVMHLNLAGIYEERGQLDQALPHFEAALKIEPNNIEAHYLAGGVCFRLNNFSCAEQHLTAALRLKPQHLEARKQLAEVYLRTGRAPDARRELIRVIEMSPTDVEARMKLQSMGL